MKLSLEIREKIKLPAALISFFKMAEKNGARFFLVGGGVRDLITNQIHNREIEIHDFDFVMIAEKERFATAKKGFDFEERPPVSVLRYVENGKKGEVEIVLLAREDKKNSSSCADDNSVTSLDSQGEIEVDKEQDLTLLQESAKDRDFRMNAIFLEVIYKDGDCIINDTPIDFFNGIKDISELKLHTVDKSDSAFGQGLENSIKRDYALVRIFRAIDLRAKYFHQYNLKLAYGDIFSAVGKLLSQDQNFCFSSVVLIRQLKKMFSSLHGQTTLKMIERLGISEKLFPNYDLCKFSLQGVIAKVWADSSKLETAEFIGRLWQPSFNAGISKILVHENYERFMTDIQTVASSILSNKFLGINVNLQTQVVESWMNTIKSQFKKPDHVKYVNSLPPEKIKKSMSPTVSSYTPRMFRDKIELSDKNSFPVLTSAEKMKENSVKPLKKSYLEVAHNKPDVNDEPLLSTPSSG